jgi:mRNA interferase MazF
MPVPIPQRGEIWQADLGYLGKIRPVLVVGVPYDDNERALLLVMAHTTSVWNTRFEVNLAHPALESGVFDAQQIFMLPPPKFIRRFGVLSVIQMESIERAMASVLGLKR